MTDTKKSYSFIGNDCPPGYRRVGTIDVADPADVHSAQDKGYRIGTIYNGYSGSCAEPCAADIYERPDEEPFPQPSRKDGGEPCGECRIQPGETCDICGAVNPPPETNVAGPRYAHVGYQWRARASRHDLWSPWRDGPCPALAPKGTETEERRVFALATTERDAGAQ